EDLVAVPRGVVADVLDQVADLVDAPVARRVHFQDVHAVARRDLATRDAFAARFAGQVAVAVQRLGQDARGGGRAAAAGARQQERVRDPPRAQRVDQGARDVLLAHELPEVLRAPLTG